MASVLMPVFGVAAVVIGAGLVFIVYKVHKYPNRNPADVELPEVPENSPLRTWMR